jgi:hypothetical protein
MRTMNLVNLGQLKAEDFEAGAPGGVFLKHEGMRRYFGAFEEWMISAREGAATFRETLQEEVRRFAAAIRARTPFRPFRLAGEAECVTLSATT